jgi:hypothetical protein
MTKLNDGVSFIKQMVSSDNGTMIFKNPLTREHKERTQELYGLCPK